MGNLQQRQKQFWQLFEKLLFEANIVEKFGRAKPHHYYDVLFGNTGVMISNTINTQQNLLSSRFYLRPAKGDLILEQLSENRQAIKRMFNPQYLSWNPRPDDKVKTIGVQLEIDFDNKQKWSLYLGWLLSMNLHLRTVYREYVSQ